jgi:hypothetical protein
MSENAVETRTQHAMLVLWGQYAQALGLIQEFSKVPLHQKRVRHSPHTKILEFLLAILGGLEHLQELSTAAEPIEKDQAVARAWMQPGWVDYSSVSRALTALTQEEAEQIVEVFDRVGQPIIDREVMLALASPGYLVYDGDLTPRPVSNTSTTYPEAAYGRMDENELGLGYQAAQVSVQSPTYGRLVLSSRLHPGDIVSCTQAEAMVQAAEARIGMRPRRRTGLLAQRLEAASAQRIIRERRYEESRQALEKVQAQLPETWTQIEACQAQLAEVESQYQQQGRKERPFSALGKLRNHLGVLQRRRTRLDKKLPKLEKQLAFRRKRLVEILAEEQELRQHLEKLERENAHNLFPIRAFFRLDAGFGSRENLIWLIEMGYEVYTRPHGRWLTARLKRKAAGATWTRVGDNAEMVAWKALLLKDFPYPLDVGLERFHTGSTLRHTTMIHFGSDPVTEDLEDWFGTYNARQTIEAGIKEGKSTFAMHHLKVRSIPALFLQEQFARFAANFVRWAAQWLAEQCPQLPTGWDNPAQPKVKQQVKVAAHTSAWVCWQEQGCLLRFTNHSVFAGKSLQVSKSAAIQLALPFAEKVQFQHF